MSSKKRLIDANEFGRYLADVQLANRGWKDDFCEFIDDVMDALNEFQAVDAVDVVRCKECAKDGLFTCPICFIENKTLQFINHSPDFYCGEGERKMITNHDDIDVPDK